MNESFLNIVLFEEVDFVRFNEDERGIHMEVHYKDGGVSIAREQNRAWRIAEFFAPCVE